MLPSIENQKLKDAFLTFFTHLLKFFRRRVHRHHSCSNQTVHTCRVSDIFYFLRNHVQKSCNVAQSVNHPISSYDQLRTSATGEKYQSCWSIMPFVQKTAVKTMTQAF